MTAWRYTMLAAGKGGSGELATVIQTGDLGPADGHIGVGDILTDAGLPPLPGDGLWLWLDFGTTVATGGEYPDESEPTWTGAWVSLHTRHVASLAAGGRVCFDDPAHAVEIERNDALARIDMLPLLAEVMPGRERDVGVPQAVSEAIAEVRRLRAEVERLRYRLDVDEQDVDEADIGDITEHEDSPHVLAWMAANGFEMAPCGVNCCAGIWTVEGTLVHEGPPHPSEDVVNDLARAVGRPPLDVLDEAMPVDREDEP